MITEDYVSFETAKLLKEKGFDEPVQVYVKTYNYPSDTVIQNIKKITGKNMEQIEVHSLFNSEDEPFFNSVEGKDKNLFAYPTLQMVMKWLREEYSLEIYPYHNNPTIYNPKWWFEIIKYPNSIAEYESGKDEEFDTYEEACEAAIKYCLENLI